MNKKDSIAKISDSIDASHNHSVKSKLTNHEKAIITYEILQIRKYLKKDGEMAADNFRFERRDKQRKMTNRIKG